MIFGIIGIIIGVSGIWVTYLLSPEEQRRRVRRWFAKSVSVIAWSRQRRTVIWRTIMRRPQQAKRRFVAAVELKIFKLRGRKMQANLESHVRPILDDDSLSRGEKGTLIAIDLYGDGSDNQGLPSFVRGNPDAVKQCFYQAKATDPKGYKLLCGKLAIHIVLQATKASQDEKEADNKDYTSYKIPWEGLLEPFFKNVLDS